MIRSRIERIIWSVWLMMALVLVRTSDHMPNVAPVAAIALWAGAVWPLPVAAAVPLMAMLIADVVIGLASWPVMLSVYISYGLITGMGWWLKQGFNPGRIVGTSLLGATLFYLVTNAAVWWFDGLYPKTLGGLVLSYYYAIPFFRNTLFGDVVYTGALFVGWFSWPVAAGWLAGRIKRWGWADRPGLREDG